MLRRVRETRTVELLRASGEEVRAKVESGDWTINRARRELGLPALGPAGDTTAQARPDGLSSALQWHGLITDDEVADWQRYWEQVMAEGRPHRIITLPSRTAIHPSRPRKSAPRGLPRMREHTRSLLLNALRGDGTPRSAARIAVCRAYRVLPGEIGLSPTGGTASCESAAEEIREDLEADLGIIAAELSFGLPDGLEYQLEAPAPGYTERLEPLDLSDVYALLERPLTPRPITDRLSPVAKLWLDPHRAVVDAFLDHDLIEPAAKGAIPPWSRWTTRQNLVAFAVFIALALIPLLVGLFAH
jgi:hypothetical protein